ncbi:anti-sigma factor [Streptomyces sp. NPDC046985]|uniref:anti-sigma factor n=1 Tax=Streptomyces sp. NPDC046985 TaxID=3155377 RepID=UPI0033FD0FD5
MNRGPDPHDAVGAYVLNALPPDERAAFESHLSSCPACRQEASQLMDAVVGLAEAAAVPPDSAVRARVLDGVRRTPQEAPPTPPEAPRTAAAAPSGGVRRTQRWVPWALAACLAGTAAGGSLAWWQYEQAQDARRLASRAEWHGAELAEVLTARDAVLRTGDLSKGGLACVVASRQQRKAVFISYDLPTLSRQRVYQLWYSDHGAYRSAGLLAGAGGQQARVLLGTLDSATAIGITVEPANGSPQPTTPPLGMVQI